MTSGRRDQVALLVNPVAGRGRGRRLGAVVAGRLRAHGLGVTELVGRSGSEAAQHARDAARAAAALVVVGGDGTVHQAVNALAGAGVPLGVVPAGAGNDAARALGLPLDPARALDVVVDALTAGGRAAGSTGPPGGPMGAPARVDLARVDAPAGVRRFLTVLAAGFDARVNARAARLPLPRALAARRYQLGTLAELPGLRPARYCLDLDGDRHWVDAVLVAVGNGPSYGGGLRVCPDARLDDGLLDVLVVRPLPRAELLRVFPRVYRGEHVGHPAVELHRARRVRVAVDGPGWTTWADGEPLAAPPVLVTAEPAALPVLLPRPAGQSGAPA